MMSYMQDMLELNTMFITNNKANANNKVNSILKKTAVIVNESNAQSESQSESESESVADADADSTPLNTDPNPDHNVNLDLDTIDIKLAQENIDTIKHNMELHTLELAAINKSIIQSLDMYNNIIYKNSNDICSKYYWFIVFIVFGCLNMLSR